MDTRQIRALLRSGPYAWPGGYPMFFLADDCEALCFDCVKSNYRIISHSTRHKMHDGWQLIRAEINWEDDSLTCAHCDKRIESAYSDNEIAA